MQVSRTYTGVAESDLVPIPLPANPRADIIKILRKGMI